MKIFGAWILACSFFWGHPHVFVDASFDLTLHKTQADIHVFWRFDEMTSMMLLMDFDKNGDGKLDEEEVRFLQQEAFNHLASLNYYTFIAHHTTTPLLITPKHFQAHTDGLHVTYSFRLTIPLDPNSSSLVVSCYDEDNLVAFFLEETVKATTSRSNTALSHTFKREDRDFYSATLLYLHWKEHQ
ncbi:MAG: DUF1007 family protein [Campylobacterales bacterium]|nr:DUF1007 family protein [Campylobacterales bacterium]